jgi:hypothetical protein
MEMTINNGSEHGDPSGDYLHAICKLCLDIDSLQEHVHNLILVHYGLAKTQSYSVLHRYIFNYCVENSCTLYKNNSYNNETPPHVFVNKSKLEV